MKRHGVDRNHASAQMKCETTHEKRSLAFLKHASVATLALVLGSFIQMSSLLAQEAGKKLDPASLSDAQLLEIYGKKACARASHEGDDGQQEYLPVDGTCSVLGCLPGALPSVPEAGQCGVPTKPEHCPNGLDQKHPGRCNGLPMQIPLQGNSIWPKRFHLLASPWLSSGNTGYGGLEWEVAAGGRLDLGLGSSTIVRGAQGQRVHLNVPTWYLSAGGFASSNAFGGDLGLSMIQDSTFFTRFGGGAASYGLLGDPAWAARVGAELHVEIVHNLALKGVWLPIGDKLGPRWVVGVEYMKCLVDEVLPFARECSE